MYYVYLAKLTNNTFYTGYTAKDPYLREREHNKGSVSHTRKFKPVKLVGYIAFRSRKKALQFEKYLKSGSSIAFRNKRLV